MTDPTCHNCKKAKKCKLLKKNPNMWWCGEHPALKKKEVKDGRSKDL
jgi:hypothetical protein